MTGQCSSCMTWLLRTSHRRSSSRSVAAIMVTAKIGGVSSAAAAVQAQEQQLQLQRTDLQSRQDTLQQQVLPGPSWVTACSCTFMPGWQAALW